MSAMTEELRPMRTSEKNGLLAALVGVTVAIGWLGFVTVENKIAAARAQQEANELRQDLDKLQTAFETFKKSQPHARYIEAEVRAFDRERAGGGSKLSAVEKASQAKREAAR
jgi:hypothetical protein